MAAAITLRDGTVPRGGVEAINGTGFVPGRTLIHYINGNFAGISSVGPAGNIGYGNMRDMLEAAPNLPVGAAKPVMVRDATDPTVNATTTITVTT